MEKIISFDFSISKPAATVFDGEEIRFFIWPLHELTKPMRKFYGDSGVLFWEREIILDEKNCEKELTPMTLENVRNARNLSKLITNSLTGFYDLREFTVINEGFSYGSVGSQLTRLAGWKYIFINTLMEYSRKMFFYSPSQIKKTAGMTYKDGKEGMIRSFCNDLDCPLTRNIVETDKWKGQCVDDIADSYWGLKTYINSLGVYL